ncbi:MAG: hypothetical protein G8345_16450 [Magnetococcales bacterium]|nr:hypothetical protein [Magnetococcales bacterium]NGZ28467.1 hypothetical protein [Magnetococcales bacterium]
MTKKGAFWPHFFVWQQGKEKQWLVFQQFGTLFLWSRHSSENPTITQSLVVSDCLLERATRQPALLRSKSKRLATPISKRMIVLGLQWCYQPDCG